MVASQQKRKSIYERRKANMIDLCAKWECGERASEREHGIKKGNNRKIKLAHNRLGPTMKITAAFNCGHRIITKLKTIHIFVFGEQP